MKVQKNNTFFLLQSKMLVPTSPPAAENQLGIGLSLSLSLGLGLGPEVNQNARRIGTGSNRAAGQKARGGKQNAGLSLRSFFLKN